MIITIRVDTVRRVVVAHTIKLDAETIERLALWDWQRFKEMMCRGTGLIQAQVTYEDGRVMRYNCFEGCQQELSF